MRAGVPPNLVHELVMYRGAAEENEIEVSQPTRHRFREPVRRGVDDDCLRVDAIEAFRLEQPVDVRRVDVVARGRPAREHEPYPRRVADARGRDGTRLGIRAETCADHDGEGHGGHESNDRRRDRGAPCEESPVARDGNHAFPMLGVGPASRNGSGIRRGQGRRQPRVVADDLAGEPLQLGARLQTEVAGKRLPSPLVDVERLGRPAGAIESEHELRDEALAVRVLVHQGSEQRNRVVVAAEREVRLGQTLAHSQAELVELVHLCAGDAVQRRVAQGGPAPETKRLSCERGCALVVAGLGGRGDGAQEVAGLARVESRAREIEPVAASLAHD